MTRPDPVLSREVIRHPEELAVAILDAASRGVRVSVADAYTLEDGRMSIQMGLQPQHSYLPTVVPQQSRFQPRGRDLCVVVLTLVVGAFVTALVFLSLVVIAWVSSHAVETAVIVLVTFLAFAFLASRVLRPAAGSGF
jgi:hypothetical protein